MSPRWQDHYKEKLITADEAARLVKSGDRVAFAIMSDPEDIGMALACRKDELRGVTLIGIWQYDYPWLHPGLEESFRVKESFTLTPSRQAIRDRRNDWVPTVYGLNDGIRQAEPDRSSVYHFADVFFIKLSAPNKDGYCSFGHAHWLNPTTLRTAKTVVAEIDSGAIWTYGDSVHISELDYLVEGPPPKAEPEDLVPPIPENELLVADAIGRSIASLVRDGDCIEIGSGTATEAAIPYLNTKNDLGIYSEVILPGMVKLVQAGVVTGKRKQVEPGKVTCTMLWLYPGDPKNRPCLDFMSENPAFQFHDISWICHIPRLAANDNMVSINNLLSIDLCGQAVATHLGLTPHTGYGGGMEFTIGPHYSRGGRVFHALMSTAKNGTISRIVPRHDAGTVVSYPTVYMDYLVTEHGIVNLSGKSRREIADAIISVAQPKFQPELRAAAKRMFWP